MSNRKKLRHVGTFVSSDGELEYCLLTPSQFRAACEASDGWEYVAPRAYPDEGKATIQIFESVAAMLLHITANNIKLAADEIGGMTY